MTLQSAAARCDAVLRSMACIALAILALPLGFAAPLARAEPAGEEHTLQTITVTARRVANDLPAGTVAAPVTLLRYDPQFDVQSRGVAETQADVTVRGGVFENTGFKIGAVTLFDPQTGHYAAELPIDPAALGYPALRTGIDNAIAGFNSAIATVDYELTRIGDAGTVGIGSGTDGFRFGEFRLARRFAAPGDPGFGASVAYATSEGDGSRENGDHDLERCHAAAPARRRFEFERSARRLAGQVLRLARHVHRVCDLA